MKKYKVWILIGVVCSLGVCVGIFIMFHQSGKHTTKKLANIYPSLPVPASTFDNKINGEIVFVPRVIDGDTIVVETVDPLTGAPGKQETVRYIGMDTPETVDPNKPVECYGHEASEENKTLVEGKYVLLEKDRTDRDKYGRLLRFVYVQGGASTTFVDLELVKEGYARVLTIPPNVGYKNEFDTAADEARSAKLGFWGACAKYPFVSY